MVVTGARPQLTGALIIPDEQTWTMSGSDPAGDGLRPAFALGEAKRALVPEGLPVSLDEPLEACLAELPAHVEIEYRALPGLVATPAHATEHGDEAMHGEHAMHGRSADHAMHGNHAMHTEHEGHESDGGHGGHEMHGDHGGHGDHGDMMAIVGDPSADGLVMEPIELRYGPLATPLPGGLALDVTLDGDVVSECAVHALLAAGEPDFDGQFPPDLLAPVSWSLAIDAAIDGDGDAYPWRRLAALEAERAVSHLAWLRAFGRLLDWPPLVEGCTRALAGLPPLAHELVGRSSTSRDALDAALPTLRGAAARVDRVLALVTRSRTLRLRTVGVGVLTGKHAAHAGVRGANARASGISDDARAGDPLYDRLGFTPVLHAEGDAHARTLVRAEEALASLRLAEAALREDVGKGTVPADFPTEGIEGPRGPLNAERPTTGWRLSAPGTEEARAAAGAAMVGAEWSDGLVSLASFDLSPWRIEA